MSPPPQRKILYETLLYMYLLKEVIPLMYIWAVHTCIVCVCVHSFSAVVTRGYTCTCIVLCSYLQQVSFWVASPSLPLRIYGRNGKVSSDVGVHVHVTILTATELNFETVDARVISYFSNLYSCCIMKKRERTGYQQSRNSNQRVSHLSYGSV